MNHKTRKKMQKKLKDTRSIGWTAGEMATRLRKREVAKDECIRLREHDNGQLDLIVIAYTEEDSWSSFGFVIRPPTEEKTT